MPSEYNLLLHPMHITKVLRNDNQIYPVVWLSLFQHLGQYPFKQPGSDLYSDDVITSPPNIHVTLHWVMPPPAMLLPVQLLNTRQAWHLRHWATSHCHIHCSCVTVQLSRTGQMKPILGRDANLLFEHSKEKKSYILCLNNWESPSHSNKTKMLERDN